MAVTVIEIPKVILSLSLEAGGDLPDATTYFFTGWMGQGAGYYGGAWGEAADEVSITTTAPNQQIRIDWSYWHDSILYSGVGVYSDMLALLPEAEPGNGNYRDSIFIKWDYYSMLDGGGEFYKWCNLNDPAITDEFQDGSGHRRWAFGAYYGSGIRADYGTFNTSAFVSPDTGVFNHGQLAWRYNLFNNHGPWPMEKSDIVFIIDGVGNTEWDLVNTIAGADPSLLDRVYLSNDNAYAPINSFNITMKGSMIGTGSITLEKVSLVTVSSTQILCPNVTYSNCFLGSNMLTPNLWFNVRGTYNDTVFNHAGNAMILDNAIASNFKPYCQSGTTSYGAITGLYIDGVPQHQWRYFKPTMPITDSTFRRTQVTATANSVSHDYRGVDAITWTNVKFLDSINAWDVSFTYSYIIAPEVGHDEINAYGVEVNRPDGKLKCLWSSFAAAAEVSSIVNVFQPLNIIVKDKDGVEIVGASISIIDNISTQYSDVTDVNGEYSENLKSYSVELDPLDSDGEGRNSKTIDYNDFRIVISANGYQVYETVFSIYEETDMEIALILDTVELNPGGLTNAYESEAMRHLFLNEAIPKIGDAAGLLPSAVAGSLFVALFTQSPGESGSIASEVTYTGYARIPVPRTAAGWTEFLGTVRNFNQVNFGENSGSDVTISHYGVMKELTGSDMVCYGSLNDPKLIYLTAQPQFAPAQLEFNID